MGKKRFNIYFDKHFGICIFWGSGAYQLEISICLPFFKVELGLGKNLYEKLA